MLAYKFVVIMAMIGEVNYYAPRLQLPFDVPVKNQDIRFLLVVPPDRGEFEGGRIQVKNYAFIFHKEHAFSLRNLAVDRKESFGIPLLHPGEPAQSVLDRASRMKYTVSTNDTYRIATNVLGALDIDLMKLEKANPYVNDYPLYNSDHGWVPNPVLIADWQNTNDLRNQLTQVLVTVSAVSGELLEVQDHGYFRKTELLPLHDLQNLLAISDEEFLKYSTLERSNLVVRFTGLHCDTMHCPDVPDPPSIETNAIPPIPTVSK